MQARRELPIPPVRERLRETIDHLAATNQRLAELESGQERCREQLRTANTKLEQSQSALARLKQEEPERLANSFLNGQADDNPVVEAKASVETAQAEVDRLEQVERALADQIERVQGTLRTLRATQLTLLSELVCSSPEFQSLVAAHTAAWRQLRTIKTALRIVSTGLHGYMPQRLMEEAARAEPLEERVSYPVDHNLIGAWADAMAALEIDADAELPHWCPAPEWV